MGTRPTIPVACTLDAAQLPGRLDEWRRMLSHGTDRTALDAGTRVALDDSTPLDQLAVLVQAEHACCAFFAFAITVDDRGLALEVRAPAEGLAAVESLLTPSP